MRVFDIIWQFFYPKKIVETPGTTAMHVVSVPFVKKQHWVSKRYNFENECKQKGHLFSKTILKIVTSDVPTEGKQQGHLFGR